MLSRESSFDMRWRFGAHSLIPVSLFFSSIAVSFGDSPAIPGGAIIYCDIDEWDEED